LVELPQRFWDNVEEVESGCWEWRAGRLKDGYGKAFLGGHWLAHRLAYTVLVGPIPEGLNVLHHCDNPPCVNPEHLFVGTQSDNMRDCVAKSRMRENSGEANPHAKLTVTQVVEIRARCRPGRGSPVNQTRLAEEYGITQAQVSAIVLGKSWLAA